MNNRESHVCLFVTKIQKPFKLTYLFKNKKKYHISSNLKANPKKKAYLATNSSECLKTKKKTNLSNNTTFTKDKARRKHNQKQNNKTGMGRMNNI